MDWSDSMEHKQTFFIYNRREMAVLILLGVLVTIFAFTLGVHFGKRAAIESRPKETAEAVVADTQNDQLPNRQELTEQGKAVAQAVDESLNETLHDEVIKTGVKLNTPVPVDLPEKTRAVGNGATTAAANTLPPTVKTGKPAPTPNEAEQTIPAALRPSPGGKYTLQVGSYPSVEEAKQQAETLDAQGHKSFLRSAVVKGKGKWYRVFIGGYQSREGADQAGRMLKNKGVVNSYIVANQVE